MLGVIFYYTLPITSLVSQYLLYKVLCKHEESLRGVLMLPKSLARVVIKGWIYEDDRTNDLSESSSERIQDSQDEQL